MVGVLEANYLELAIIVLVAVLFEHMFVLKNMILAVGGMFLFNIIAVGLIFAIGFIMTFTYAFRVCSLI